MSTCGRNSRWKSPLSPKQLSFPWNLLPETYGCIFIDIHWLDMLYAISYAGSLKKHQAVQTEIESLLGGADKIMVSLSVRSAFDLLLQSINFPTGSELICTNVNIQDMKDIAEYHGLVLKPIDFDLSTMKPNVQDIVDTISSKTVGILLVQLFGRKYRTSEFLEIARKHNIILIEDCAQGFYGPACIQDAETDVTIFSLGSIKRTTCFGGAITVCKDPGILLKMRQIQQLYYYQSRLAYLRKLIKYVIVILVTNHPTLSGVAKRIFQLLGIDYKWLIKRSVKGFVGNIIEVIRFQPSLPLLLLMKRRLSKMLLDPCTSQSRAINAEYMIQKLYEKPVLVVGRLSKLRDFWLFPVLVDNPTEVENELEDLGISAFSRASSLVLMSDQDPDDKLKSSFFLLKHLLFLPIDKRNSKNNIDYVYESVVHIVEKRESIFAIADREGVSLKGDNAEHNTFTIEKT